MLIPFATANNKITARFSDSQAPASQLVSAVFESDSKWQKIAGVGIGESKSIGLASSYNYLTFVEPTGFFLDSLTPRSLAANSITAQLPDKEIINARRITTNAVFLNAAVVSIDEAETQYAIPDGIYSESFGTGDIKYLNFLVTPDGVYRDGISPSSPVSSFVTARLFRKPRLPVTRITATVAYLGAPIVDESFEPSTQHIATYGYDLQLFGSSKVWLNQQHVTSIGINNLDVGRASIINGSQGISVKGWQSSKFGLTVAYNFRQYVYQKNREDQSSYGKPYLQGGVRWLYPRAFDSLNIGKHDALNTTANQELKPGSINSLAIGALNVSPRIVYPSGFYNNGVYTNGRYETIKFGTPDIRDPAIVPKGELQTSYGNQTVWFHTRPLSPDGILSYQSGYPRVADPTQFTYPPSLIESAIFGDTAIKNTSTVIKLAGINDGSFSDYTTLTNSNRKYDPKGIDSLRMGAASIVNKTPSIFVESINPFDTGTPAIGHAIRFVVPTGFDHLLFGRAVLTKTPELKTIGHQSSVIGQSWISHKNRTIDLIQKGINSFKAGELTTWYGQRPAKISGWQTASYGNPTLTHEVREVSGQGFRRDAYGQAWVSFGTRIIEPQGIYKDFPSNHMVGGTQTIKPAGYEATLWGERIIPDSQSIQPLGFRELWGNATVDLHTNYIAPVGYISVGQQPADRWGDITVYNKLQYIVQEFDINSGLVPPKWSDYLLVANRNIQMNVTGFISQKFGYSQIDNNATPLLPEAITPPTIDGGMISHGVRTLAPEAITPIPMSDWGVVHNSGRVIAPPGVVHTGSGLPVVANTRRYYTGVGRLDSLEAGTPMIAYRIRTIDIERRYSIEPPQIELPTIDLHTKYIGFNGYETTKYGLPSLSIHFNIIGPSWRHRDDFGYGAVRNVTPELQVGAFDSQEFGRASIRTQWRHVQAQGDTATLFGSAMIADTKQQIVLRGWQDSIISQLHTVTKTGTPPYTTQNIWLQNESNPSKDGFGIKPTSEPSRPGLNQNVLYARGFIATKFGEAIVSSNNLYIDIGISIKNFGTGTSVRNQNRFIDVTGIDNTIKTSDELMVTPFYIRPRSFNQSGDYNSFPNGNKFGRTVVTNQHRTIYPRGHSSSNVGYSCRVVLHTRYVEPPTIRGFAMGFPEIPFTPKTIDVKDYGFDSQVHGEAEVSRPPYTGPQDIKGRGFNSLSISSNHRAELLHRELLAVGSDHLRMGTRLANDKPYMWQGLRIGEFVPMSIGAGDTSVFGDTRIGLRVREIPIEGFDTFRSEYEPMRFKDRMKVTRSNSSAEDNLIQSINAMGINSEAIGAIETKWGQQFIRPDGNSDQFRKGGYHA